MKKTLSKLERVLLRQARKHQAGWFKLDILCSNNMLVLGPREPWAEHESDL